MDLGYHSEEIMGDFASGTAIRKYAVDRNFYDIDKVMPKVCYDILEEAIKKGHYVSGIECYQKEIMFVLRNMTVAQIANLPDVNEGLENAIKNAVNSCNSLNSLMEMVKTKRYTRN
ncbi:MAG: nucleotidyltransferase family protein [Clostridia bacterium]|nr:nucleotidyltransferase family protein [Clostridia bacterium]